MGCLQPTPETNALMKSMLVGSHLPRSRHFIVGSSGTSTAPVPSECFSVHKFPRLWDPISVTVKEQWLVRSREIRTVRRD